MSESLVQTKVYEEPQEVEELFMKKYIEAEKSHHYEEKHHFPSQYTFYWEKEELAMLISKLLEPLALVADKAISLLREHHPVYEEYAEQVDKVVDEIDTIDSLLAFFLVWIDEKTFTSSWVTSVLNKPYIEQIMKAKADENVSNISCIL